jgi:tetratricopeptide (TPR) repeat protein
LKSKLFLFEKQRLGDFEKADEAFSKCLTLQPSNSHTLWLRGMTRYLSGNHVHAMRDFRMCLKLKSDSLEARNLLAVALAARGRYRECVAECDTILKMSPENPVW